MRIRELQIERFGIWEDVTLPVNERDITVLYGPNEAGKSTLMRFIRGVLYGFPQDQEPRGRLQRATAPCSGSLHVTHSGQDFEIKRTSRSGTRGDLFLNGRRVDDDDADVKKIVGGANEALFQNIFAIGLHELQQLATLHGDEVASHIYSLSLGPEGKQLFRAQTAFTEEQTFLVGEDASGGEVSSLLSQLKEMDEELQRVGHPRDHYSRLQTQLLDLEGDIAERKQQQSRLQHDLRGHQFVRKIWEPWKKERSLQRQLDALPSNDFDQEVLDRLDDLEIELSELGDQRNQLIEEARRLQKEAEAIKLRPELEEHGCAIQQLREQSPEIQALERELDGRQRGDDPREREVKDLLAQLDGKWDLRRLEATDISPRGIQRIVEQGQQFRRALRLRSRNARKYKRMAAAMPALQNTWKTQAKSLGTESAPDARKALLQRLSDLEELRGLRLREQHLRKVVGMFVREQADVPESDQLPPFFWSIILFFVISGVCLLAAGAYAAFHGYDGIVAGGPTAWIVGGCYTFLGLATLGTSWTMKEHFSTDEVRVGKLGAERESAERELNRITGAIERITRKDAFRPPLAETVPAKEATSEPVTEDQLIDRTRQQLVDVDEFERLGKNIERRRQRMAKMRQSLQDRQRRVARARQEWSQTLQQVGLADTLKVSAAIDQCQIIAEARERLDAWESTHQSEQQKRHQIEKFLKKVERLASILDHRDVRMGDAHQRIIEWERELQLQGERRRERNQLRQTAKAKRREAARLVDKLEQKRQQRSRYLERLGVTSRDEIARRLAAIEQRGEIQKQLDAIREQIRNIAQDEPDLAIVEDDLERFEESRSQQAINELKRQLEEIDELLKEDYERIGQLKHELSSVEQDRTLTSLRYERAQIVDALRIAMERWCATRLADNVVGQLCRRIESERQPEILTSASAYLHRLTCGKYQKIWNPLGERILLVDDDQRQSLRLEQLSSGTREQVFLAVRMAMIRDFAAKGIELPMILDDVTVNFDQVRTEAAVEALLDIADQGQQVLLFTCHLHLAHLFESEGLEPVWLPAQHSQVQVHS